MKDSTSEKFSLTSRKTWSYLWGNYNFVFLFIAMFSVFLIINFQAMNWAVFSNILRHSSVIGIVALGMGLIILTGNIDLSLGSMIAFIGGISVLVFNSTESLILTFVFSIVAGAICGLLNGVLVAIIKMPSFIATLATMLIFRSISSYIMAGRMGIAMFRLERNSSFEAYFYIGNRSFLDIPILFWIFLIVTVLMIYMTTSTKFGKSVYAVGSNEKASRLAGVNVTGIRVLVYTVAGALTGLAAALLSGQMGGILAGTAALNFELYAIAAVVIGGIAMSGGKGKMIGIIFGVITFTVVDNIIMVAALNPLLNNAFNGIIVLAAVLVQQLQRQK